MSNEFYKPPTKNRCKICNSKHCDKINKLVANNTTNAEIIKKASRFRPKFIISNRNIALHKKNHLLKLKTKDKTKKKKSNIKKETIKVSSMVDFLDLVIDKVNTKILNGEIIPTVTEAVKAAEIKSKIKEGSKFEKELLKFFMDVSNKNDKS